MVPLISRGESLPRWREETFTTGDDNQSSISIRLYRGESEDVTENTFVGRYEVIEIPPGPAGASKVKIRFPIADGELRLTATDSGTGLDMPIVVEP